MRRTILALVLSLTVAAPALAQNKAEKEVLAALDTWKQAMIKKDKATFEKVLHPDLAYGHSSGLIETKAEAIQHVLGNAGSYVSIDTPDPKVRVHGKMAIVSGKTVYLERVNGKETPINMVVLSVWVKEPSGWQMIGRQSTKPPPATPTAAAAPAPAAAAPAPAKR